MTPQETVLLTRYVKACCPGSQIDEYTPDAWHDLLGDLSLSDCRDAVAAVAMRQPFVAPAEIRAEVKRIRSDRIGRALIPPPPAELADDPQAYRKALAESVRAAADGHAPLAEDGPKVIGPPPGQRTGGPPQSLGSAIRDLRRQMGTARARAAIEAPEAIAARQAAGHREIEAARDDTEEAS
jgi:hypothetical protein